jgi:hypothetical protein
MNKIKMLVAVAVCVAGVSMTTGCKTGPDGKRVPDVAKIADAKDTVEPVAASAIRRALKNSPEHAPEIAKYLAAVGGVFCTMSISNEFSPVFLIEQSDRLLDPALADIADGLVLDLKGALVATYKILWRDAGRAEIPSDTWLHQVVEFFCDSITRGLSEAGYPGGVKLSSAGMRQNLERLMASSTP